MLCASGAIHCLCWQWHTFNWMCKRLVRPKYGPIIVCFLVSLTWMALDDAAAAFIKWKFKQNSKIVFTRLQIYWWNVEKAHVSQQQQQWRRKKNMKNRRKTTERQGFQFLSILTSIKRLFDAKRLFICCKNVENHRLLGISSKDSIDIHTSYLYRNKQINCYWLLSLVRTEQV